MVLKGLIESKCTAVYGILIPEHESSRVLYGSYISFHLIQTFIKTSFIKRFLYNFQKFKLKCEDCFTHVNILAPSQNADHTFIVGSWVTLNASNNTD